jgi:hypothetical protein
VILARVAVLVSVLMFAVFGAWLLLAPEKLGTWLGVEANTAKARTEVRAFYGGIQLGIVLLGLIAVFVRPDWLAVTCAALSCQLLSVVTCRIYGMVVDGSASATMWTVLATEAVAGGLALVAFLTMPAQSAGT